MGQNLLSRLSQLYERSQMRAHEARGDRWLGLMSSWTGRQQCCGGSKEISVSSPRDKDQCWVFWRVVWVPSSSSRREHSKAQAYSQALWCSWRWQGRRMETECVDTRSALTCPRWKTLFPSEKSRYPEACLLEIWTCYPW